MEGYDPDASTASASEALGYRQRLEKPAGGDLLLMKWSPTMDLLAATFADNSVCCDTEPLMVTPRAKTVNTHTRETQANAFGHAQFVRPRWEGLKCKCRMVIIYAFR